MEEDNPHFSDKSRRNSSSAESHGSRRSSIASKSKRLSVPHINPSRNNLPSATHSTHPKLADKKDTPQLISRRNTLPNISISSGISNSAPEDKIPSPIVIENSQINLLESPSRSSNLNTIIEEEPTEDFNIFNFKSCDVDLNSRTMPKRK